VSRWPFKIRQTLAAEIPILRGDLARSEPLFIQSSDALPIHHERRPAADAALLAGLRQSGMNTLGETDALLLCNRGQDAQRL
jgi:hypothetical protein